MKFGKFVDVYNELVEVLNRNDLTYLEALLIVEKLKEDILEKVEDE